ncbi:hypothetical protein ACWGPZ_30010 [Priestia megaterium]
MKSAFLGSYYLGIIITILPIVAMLYFQTIEQVFVFNLVVGIVLTVFSKIMLQTKFKKEAL